MGSTKGMAMVIDVGYGPMVVAHPDDLVELASVLVSERLAVLECPVCGITCDTPAGLSMHRDGVGQPCGPVKVTPRSQVPDTTAARPEPCIECVAAAMFGEPVKSNHLHHGDTEAVKEADRRVQQAIAAFTTRTGWPDAGKTMPGPWTCSNCQKVQPHGVRRFDGLPACPDCYSLMSDEYQAPAKRAGLNPAQVPGPWWCPTCKVGKSFGVRNDNRDIVCPACFTGMEMWPTGQAPECDCSGCDCGMECKPDCSSQQPANPGPKALYKDGHGNWHCADCHALKDACTCWVDVDPDAETWTCDQCSETFGSDTAHQDHQQDHDYCMVCGVSGACQQHDAPAQVGG